MRYVNKKLKIGRVDVHKIALKYGTPSYCYYIIIILYIRLL